MGPHIFTVKRLPKHRQRKVWIHKTNPVGFFSKRPENHQDYDYICVEDAEKRDCESLMKR